MCGLSSLSKHPSLSPWKMAGSGASVQECEDYITKHEIQKLLKECIVKICQERPGNPYKWLREYFDKLDRVSCLQWFNIKMRVLWLLQIASFFLCSRSTQRFRPSKVTFLLFSPSQGTVEGRLVGASCQKSMQPATWRRYEPVHEHTLHFDLCDNLIFGVCCTWYLSPLYP